MKTISKKQGWSIIGITAVFTLAYLAMNTYEKADALIDAAVVTETEYQERTATVRTGQVATDEMQNKRLDEIEDYNRFQKFRRLKRDRVNGVPLSDDDRRDLCQLARIYNETVPGCGGV